MAGESALQCGVASVDIARLKVGAVASGLPATLAQLNGLHDIRISPADGNLYIADPWNSRIRKIDRHRGVLVTVAGDGPRGLSGDGGQGERERGASHSVTSSSQAAASDRRSSTRCSPAAPRASVP